MQPALSTCTHQTAEGTCTYNAHIDVVPVARPCSGSSLAGRFSLPGIVLRYAVCGIREGLVQVIDSVLPLQMAARGDSIVPAGRQGSDSPRCWRRRSGPGMQIFMGATAPIEPSTGLYARVREARLAAAEPSSTACDDVTYYNGT